MIPRQIAMLATSVFVVSGVSAAAAEPSPTSARPAGATAPAATKKGLHVSGNRLLDGRGRVVRFRGVNRAGTEYACIQGWGIFDGPSGEESVKAMADWHLNAVRIPLNEDCWLDISGVDP